MNSRRKALASGSFWPNYSELYPGKNWPSRAGLLLRDTQAWGHIFVSLAYVAVYVVLTRISPPHFDASAIKAIVNESHFLKFIDIMFTGGAVSHLSPLAVGAAIYPFLSPISFSSAGTIGRVRFRIRLSPSVIIGMIAISIGAAYLAAVNHSIPNDRWSIIGASFYWATGVLLFLLISFKFTQHTDIDIIAINAGLLVAGYFQSFFHSNQTVPSVILACGIVLFLTTFPWVMSGVRSVQMIHIAGERPHLGLLLLPVSSDWLRQIFLLVTVLITFGCTVVVNISADIFNLVHISPLGQSAVDGAFALSCLALSTLICLRSRTLRFALGPFDAHSLASDLQRRFWILGGEKSAEAMEPFLNQQSARSRAITFLFYLGWTAFFVAIIVWANAIGTSLVWLPLGPVAFIFALGFVGEAILAFLRHARSYFVRLNYKEFWATPPQGGLTVAFPPQLRADDLLKGLNDDDFRLQLSELLANDSINKSDLFKFVDLLARRARTDKMDDQSVLSLSKSFFKQVFASLVLSSCFCWLLDYGTKALFRDFTHETSYKPTLLSFWLGGIFSLVFTFETHKTLKALVRNIFETLRSKTRPKHNDDL